MLADVYFPDTTVGRSEAMRLYPDPNAVVGSVFAFCREYEPERPDPVRWTFAPPRDLGNELPCCLRDPRYLEGTNKCRRCPAGFALEAAAGLMPDGEMH